PRCTAGQAGWSSNEPLERVADEGEDDDQEEADAGPEEGPDERAPEERRQVQVGHRASSSSVASRWSSSAMSASAKFAARRARPSTVHVNSSDSLPSIPAASCVAMRSRRSARSSTSWRDGRGFASASVSAMRRSYSGVCSSRPPASVAPNIGSPPLAPLALGAADAPRHAPPASEPHGDAAAGGHIPPAVDALPWEQVRADRHAAASSGGRTSSPPFHSTSPRDNRSTIACTRFDSETVSCVKLETLTPSSTAAANA